MVDLESIWLHVYAKKRISHSCGLRLIMLRSFFLYLSGSRQARRMLMALPFATRVARRFIAGETLDDAIRTVQTLNAKGLLVSLDHLGENVHTEVDAARATQDYLDLLDRIAAMGVKANSSLKLTALR